MLSLLIGCKPLYNREIFGVWPHLGMWRQARGQGCCHLIDGLWFFVCAPPTLVINLIPYNCLFPSLSVNMAANLLNSIYFYMLKHDAVKWSENHSIRLLKPSGPQSCRMGLSNAFKLGPLEALSNAIMLPKLVQISQTVRVWRTNATHKYTQL
jgi:hypothetical protein